MIGRTLGPYQVVAKLGEGGMGEVYRARDTKLNRDVALKILPDSFANDPERLARFTREAQTLASLNHPNIAQIHDLEEFADQKIHALVMELVDGPDLSQRIAQGPLAVDEVVAIAKQIADAMETAHDQGIVHRDLKPANIKVRDDGTVKVLDFGLAKALEAPVSPGATGSWSLSPTMTSPAMTNVGAIIGTAAYMSPEQAKGKAVDKRADIWAFGVVLCEMLTGRALFAGETVSEVLAAVIMREPELNGLPSTLPESVRYVIARCLVKDPKLRLRDIGEARLALAGSVSLPMSEADAPTEASRSHSSRWLVALAAVLALALVATAVTLWRVWSTPLANPLVRYEVTPPAKTALALVARPSVALSPDGSMMAVTVSAEGNTSLYVRSLSELALRQLPNTDGASNPVFSFDGTKIAFFAGGRLKTTTLDGVVSTVSEAGLDGDPRGIAWMPDGSLVFASAATGPLSLVSSTGGTPRAITMLDEKKGERTHRWPSALPNGKGVLFTVGTLGSPDNYDASSIDVVRLDTGERNTVLQGAASARYASSGHLLFTRGSSVYAISFDIDRLTVEGSPVQVLQGVNGDTTTGASHITVADNGTLAYAPGSSQAAANRLMWVSRDGTAQALPLPQGLYWDPRISPDGTRVAVAWQTVTGGSSDIWVGDFSRSTFSRLSFSGNASAPVWSADGRTIYYTHIDPSGRKSSIMRRPADGSRDAESLVELDARAYLKDVTPDDKLALIDYVNAIPGGNAGQVMQIALAQNAKPEPLVTSRFDEYGGAWSPDRRWLAYLSDESGRPEVYVRDTSSTGGRWQVSTTGGDEPHWSRDGRELYYRNESRMMMVSVDTRTSFTPSAPVVLFDDVYNLRSDTGVSYDVMPKGDRFLMVRLTDDNVASTVVVVLNWFSELQRVLGGGS